MQVLSRVDRHAEPLHQTPLTQTQQPSLQVLTAWLGEIGGGVQKKCIQVDHTKVLATRNEGLLPGFCIMGAEYPRPGQATCWSSGTDGLLEAGDPTPPQHCRRPELYRASECLPTQHP